MKINSIETENFKMSINASGAPEIKATSPMSKAYLRLKGKKNPLLLTVNTATDEILAELGDLEQRTAKLADI